MSRRVLVAVAAITGFVCGALLIATLSLDDPSASGSAAVESTTLPRTNALTTADPTTTASSTTSAESPPVSSPPSTSAVESARPTAIPDDVLLVWTSGGLPAGFAAAVAEIDAITATTIGRGAELALVAVTDATGAEVERHHDGWTVPIDAIAIAPADHGPFVSDDAAASMRLLQRGTGLLSTTAAELRGVGIGATLAFASGSIEVVGIIDDRSASGAEVIVDHGTGHDLGIVDEKFLLVRYDGERAVVHEAVAKAATIDGPGAPIRFRSPSETTWLRHGDAVLPLARVKAAFGEFATRDTSGKEVEIDPAWIDANIVEADIPVIGPVRCHEAMIPALEAAMRELVDRAITQVIEPDEFAGCFVPRRIAEGQPLSRHTWGIAIDLNVGDNPRGSFSTQDPRLVDAMRTAGFGWGGSWLVPDPAHYEVLEPRE